MRLAHEIFVVVLVWEHLLTHQKWITPRSSIALSIAILTAMFGGAYILVRTVYWWINSVISKNEK